MDDVWGAYTNFPHGSNGTLWKIRGSNGTPPYFQSKTQLNPRKLRCHLKRDHFKRKNIFQPSIFRGYSLVFKGGTKQWHFFHAMLDCWRSRCFFLEHALWCPGVCENSLGSEDELGLMTYVSNGTRAPMKIDQFQATKELTLLFSTIGCMGRTVYFPLWMVNFHGKCR